MADWRGRVAGEILIEKGTTHGWVELSRTPSGVYILALKGDKNPENRWIIPLYLAIAKAFEALEHHLEYEAGDGPSALLTVSDSPKFFSNGIDPTGKYTASLDLPKPSDEERMESTILDMTGFIRPLQLPIPTIAAINGHAFGAGFMFAASHDYRLQRADRGYMCAVEIEVGVGIPPPEMTIFDHIMSAPAALESTLAAKRWGAADALREGIVVQASPAEKLFKDALAYAERQAKLATGPRGRLLFMSIKSQLKGHVGREVMEWKFPGNKIPARIENAGIADAVKRRHAYLLSHIGEEINALPGGQMVPPPPPYPKRVSKI